MVEYWNERYKQQEYAYGIAPNVFLKEQLSTLQQGKILFLCEGEGRNAIYAAKEGWEVSAFDLSIEGMKKANQLALENNVFIDYQIADAQTVNYPVAFFDVVAIIYAHFPSSIRKTIHSKVINWLKPGGIVVLEVFNPLQLQNGSGGPKELSMLYSKEMMTTDFNEMAVLKLNTEKIILNEGKFHQGMADVLRYVGQKKHISLVM
jgi:2-polyprenyl-3-methyl-5-hydroxy-6-metoxy-1,4-benzoquinol methylase